MLNNAEQDLEFFAWSYLIEELEKVDLITLAMNVDPFRSETPTHEEMRIVSKLMYLLHGLTRDDNDLKKNLEKAKDLAFKDSLNLKQKIIMKLSN